MVSATAEDVAAAVVALPDGRTRYVGIDGRGGAGKTTLTDAVARLLRDDDIDVDVVHVDDFAAPGLDEWDWVRFRDQLLLPLESGGVARYQVWDWDVDEGGDWVEVRPGGVVLVEGVSSTRQEAGVAWDLTVWVDAPADLRRARALERDGAEMWPVWRDRWIPTEEAYVARENPAARADLLVDGAR